MKNEISVKKISKEMPDMYIRKKRF